MFYLLENNRIIDSNISYTKVLPFWEEKEGRIIMNKYQEPLNNVKRVYVESEHYDEEDIRLLQELVEKATPKKPKSKTIYYKCRGDDTLYYFDFICPVCNRGAVENMEYCYQCGQALDWSGEDD